MVRFKDLTGQRFGRLTVIKKVEENTGHHIKWLCKCDCGKEVIVFGCNLTKTKVPTRSCGCLHKELFTPTTHGLSGNKLHYIWDSIKARCYNKNSTSYLRYGARGVTICDEWRDNFKAFYDWAIASGYDETAKRGDCTIDRIDVNKNYSPDNCRWVNATKQANNRRTNVIIKYQNQEKTLAEWCKLLNLPYKTIHKKIRYKGMTFEQAIYTTSY